MVRCAIIAFLLNYCGAVFSQNLSFSDRFETHKKNTPIEVVNSDTNYFYVLRYNKEAHDIIVERRTKPQGRILAFTRLKLDSVNANWFDYRKLEYLVFEQDHLFYFIFEKELNSRKDIFLKIIDTSGKSTGFIPVAALEKDKHTENVRFVFALTSNKRLMIIAEKYGLNYDVRKTVTLYDPIQKSTLWTKSLSPETESTGFTSAFEIGPDDDLYYVQVRSRVVRYKRKFANQIQNYLPVFCHDFVILNRIPRDSSSAVKVKLPLENLSALYSVSLRADEHNITSSVHFAIKDSVENETVFFLTDKRSKHNDLLYSVVTPLEERVRKQLTFYDGSDDKNAADKHYRLKSKVANTQHHFITGERIDGNYYKEMVLWKSDLSSGQVLNQEIIPRRCMIYDDIGRRSSTTQILRQNTLFTLLLEDRDNFRMGPREFKYHNFYEQSFQDDCHLVAYILHPNGDFEKKLIYDNENFRFLSIRYQSSQEDFVFCARRGRQECFVTLKLNPNL